jgi:hypothetical protein
METKEAASIVKKTDEESRREFLVKAGKMALYIPPAMMVLMHPSRNAFACNKSYNPPPPKCGPGGYQPSNVSLFNGGYSSGRHHHRR